MSEEIWVFHNEYPNYDISNHGRVRNADTKHILKAKLYENRRTQVCLYFETRSKRFSVHRMVAEHFIPEFDPSDYVRFKDRDPNNCHVDNLEIEPRSVSDMQILVIETGHIYDTLKQAADAVGGRREAVWRVLKGYRRTHMGHTFQYIPINDRNEDDYY